ncbi:MAG: ABC transporter permease [Candidatus Acidiferrales bacterium]
MTQRHKLALAAAFLAGFYGLVLFAGFFAPYDFATQNRETPYAAPTAIHFVDAQRTFHARPFVYGAQDSNDGASPSEPNAQVSHPIHFFVRGSRYKLAGLFASDVHLFGVEAPGEILLMGSDGYGRDQFSRFLYGGQVSMLAGLIAALLSVALGVIVGGIAGYYGGWIDEILMRGGELFLALPWLYLLFAVRAALPLRISQWQVFLLLVAIMGLIGWARPARLIRGVVLSAKQRNFVTAARGFGASDPYLLRRHVLPQTYGVLLTQMTLLIPQYVLAEVTLTFLGLGVGEPMPSWGALLSSLQQYSVLSSYWWMFLPAILLIPLFLVFYTAADALQELHKSVAL